MSLSDISRDGGEVDHSCVPEDTVTAEDHVHSREKGKTMSEAHTPRLGN